MKIKILFITTFSMIITLGCCSQRHVAAENDPVTISRTEYEELLKKADEQYVYIPKRIFDSLVHKTQSLQSLNDNLRSRIMEERVIGLQ